MDYKQAYEYYKSEKPENVIMIRIGDNYCAWFNDYRIVGNADHWRGKSDFPEYKFHHLRLPEVLHNLSQPVTFVEYRNTSGEFALPDIDKLAQEIEDDY